MNQEREDPELTIDLAGQSWIIPMLFFKSSVDKIGLRACNSGSELHVRPQPLIQHSSPVNCSPDLGKVAATTLRPRFSLCANVKAAMSLGMPGLLLP